MPPSRRPGDPRARLPNGLVSRGYIFGSSPVGSSCVMARPPKAGDPRRFSDPLPCSFGPMQLRVVRANPRQSGTGAVAQCGHGPGHLGRAGARPRSPPPTQSRRGCLPAGASSRLTGKQPCSPCAGARLPHSFISPISYRWVVPLPHQPRQPKRNRREGDKDGKPHDIRHHERQHATEQDARRDLREQRIDHE
jgi:hypothetical protein